MNENEELVEDTPEATEKPAAEMPPALPPSKIPGGATLVSMSAGGMIFQNQEEIVNAARIMARSGAAVGKHCRDNPGMCWAVILQAIEWRMSPLTVSRQSFVHDGNLGFFSQLLHAVLEARAPLKERLRMRYEGEGGDRICIVSGTFKGEQEPRELRSPPLKQLHPGYVVIRRTGGESAKRSISYVDGQLLLAEGKLNDNESLMVRGSQEWERKPDKQLFYDTSRDWGRIHAPDVMAGLYSDDELEEFQPIRQISDSAIDVTAAGQELAKRLAEAKADLITEQGAEPEGFKQDVVKRALRDSLLATPILDFCEWTRSTAIALGKRSHIKTVGDLIELGGTFAGPRVLAEVDIRLKEKGLQRKSSRATLRRRERRPGGAR